jgi:hypothetical protein
MHGNRPSTSAVDADVFVTINDKFEKHCCKLCSCSDIEVDYHESLIAKSTIIPETLNFHEQRQTIPPDRISRKIMFSTHFLLIVLLFNCFTTVMSTPAPLPPLPRIMVREFDDNGIGSIPFSPMHEGKKVQLQKMVYDDNTNRLIVGAVNHLYDVPTSLTETKEDVFLRDECKGRKYIAAIFFFYNQKTMS